MPHCLEDWEMNPNLVERARGHLHIANNLYRAVLSEFFCTAVLLFAGCCVNAQYVLSDTVFNDWIGVTVGWGIALFIAVCMGFRISANLNPAISMFFLTQGRISPIRFLLYVIAQTAGAFVGSALCFAVYYDAINAFDGGVRQVTGNQSTAGIFATYPQAYMSVPGACLDQALGAALLCLCIGSVIDRRNQIPLYLQPPFVGIIVTLIGMTLAMNCGGAINPARDFGPRLLTLAVGYGWEVIEYNDYTWFWIPIVCPFIGAVCGAWLYEFFIGFHMPDDVETTLADEKPCHCKQSQLPQFVTELPIDRRYTADVKANVI